MENYKEYYKDLILQYMDNYKAMYSDYLKERYAAYKYICGFSVGNMGSCVPGFVASMGRTLDFFCDNDLNKTGKKDPYGYNVDVISISELEKYKDEVAILVPTRYYKEIYKQLKEIGFPLVDRIFPNKIEVDKYIHQHNKKDIIEKLHKVIDILDDEESCKIVTRLIQEWTKNEYIYGQLDDICSAPQYFPKDIVKPCQQEVFIDCGAYIGDMIPDFINFEKGEFGKYYAFELNIDNYKKLKEEVSDKWSMYFKQFILENKGVSNITETIWYSPNEESSQMSNSGTVEGKAVALDDYFNAGEKVTFIKMDIEGAEIQALNGAYKLIANQHPKLAICVYHKPEDMWEIPLLIEKIYPQYKLYIRHHTDLLNETVCYAIP